MMNLSKFYRPKEHELFEILNQYARQGLDSSIPAEEARNMVGYHGGRIS
jgi:hypothetical protein